MNILHSTPNYDNGKSKLEIDYYKHTYFFPEKLAYIRGNSEKSGQEVMYSSKIFNSNHIDIFGYDKHDRHTRDIIVSM